MPQAPPVHGTPKLYQPDGSIFLIYQQLLTYVPLVRPYTKRAATKLSSPVSAAEPAATIGYAGDPLSTLETPSTG